MTPFQHCSTHDATSNTVLSFFSRTRISHSLFSSQWSESLTMTDLSTSPRQASSSDSSPFSQRYFFCCIFWSVPVLSGCGVPTESCNFQYGIARRGRGKILAITVFYLWLLFWDAMQGLGWILSIRWIQHSEVVTGNICTAQGIPFASLFQRQPATHITNFSDHQSAC